MDEEFLRIVPLVNNVTKGQLEDYYSICLISKGKVKLFLGDRDFENLANVIFFLGPTDRWKITKSQDNELAGQVLQIHKSVFDNPRFSKLHINDVRLLVAGQLPLIHLAPGIEKRVQSIIEMLDELIGSHLNHKEEAMLSLLNTFFIYTDGQCNIKSVAPGKDTKKNLVHSFKKSIERHHTHHHEVSDYAALLNVSSKYLNQCVKEVLGVNAKSLIIEQLIMRSRLELKFSSKSVKEIGYELGFKSPDYFSYFFKNHAGHSPSSLRNS